VRFFYVCIKLKVALFGTDAIVKLHQRNGVIEMSREQLEDEIKAKLEALKAIADNFDNFLNEKSS